MYYTIHLTISSLKYFAYVKRDCLATTQKDNYPLTQSNSTTAKVNENSFNAIVK